MGAAFFGCFRATNGRLYIYKITARYNETIPSGFFRKNVRFDTQSGGESPLTIRDFGLCKSLRELKPPGSLHRAVFFR